jgi:hypothetical protein
MSREGIDKRQTPRRVFEHSVGVLYRGQYELCKARELSEGGVSIESSWALNSGENLLVTLFLPGGHMCALRAEVRTMEKKDGQVRYNCQFKEVSLPYRRSIRNYVSAKTQEEAENESRSA